MSKNPRFSKENSNFLSKDQILIVDKIGVIGQFLCQKLASNSLVVFACKKQPDAIKELRNVIFVPYEKNLPSLPDGVYSHILVIDDFSSRTKDILGSLIKKSQKDNSVFVFATYLQKVDKELVTKVVNFYKKSYVVVYGDIFCKTAIHNIEEFKSVANDFIYQALTKGKIDVLGDGLLRTYPIFMGDLIENIVDKIINTSSTSRIFKIFPKHYRTQISLAHMIQKPNPSIQIDFVNDYKEKKWEYPALEEGKYLLEEDYPLGKKIREIDLGYKFALAKSEKFLDVKTKKKYNHLLYKTLFFLFAFLLLPFIATASFLFLGARAIDDVGSAIDKGDLSLAQQNINNSNTFLTFSEKSSKILLFETKLIGLDKKVSKLLDNIILAKTMSLSMGNLLEAANMLSNIFKGDSKNPRGELDKTRGLIKNSIISLREAEAEGKLPKNIEFQTKSLDTIVRLVGNTQDMWSDIFGFNGKRDYLVLFQNNMELRPGGGFIGSYATFSFDNGKILDFSIHDAYDADGQLKGHVEPPYALRRFLPIPHFYLRDSNFDLDFVKNASVSAFLFKEETGKAIDGVVGIDLSFVKGLIGTLGNVYVNDYKENVNKDNLFLLAESHSEKNFFPGSTQKKDFLNSLFSEIKFNLGNSKKVSYTALAKAINDSLDQKHLLFAFDNKLMQDVFVVNNWSSSLWDERKNDRSTINDFLGINEANLGANKANFFIKRKVAQNVFFEQNGDIGESIVISYFNSSEFEKWPGGDYKNFLRIIVPKSSSLSEILIDGEKQSIVPAITDSKVYDKKGFLPPKGLEVETTEDGDKTVYGFLVIVPSGKLRTITIKYNLFQKVSVDQPSFSYNHKVFKQPGTDDYLFEFSLAYPTTYRVITSLENVSKKDSVISFSKSLLSDENFSLSFAAK